MPLTALAMFLAAGTIKPYPAEHPRRPRYASESYQLAFPTPRNVWTCPFPDDWAGTDHGTILFLARPKSCSGVGYLAVQRGFEPATTPRIEIYYDRTLFPDVKLTIHPCQRVGTMRLFGRSRPLCVERSKWGMRIVHVTSLYEKKEYETTATLITSPARYRRDLAVFRRFVATIGTCQWYVGGKWAGTCTGTY